MSGKRANPRVKLDAPTPVQAGNNFVLVACRLPNGLVLEAPGDPNKIVVLNGKNRATIIGAEYGLTEVNAEFWARWLAENGDYAPVVSNAIYAVGDVASAASAAREFEDEITGFEAMDPTADKIESVPK